MKHFSYFAVLAGCLLGSLWLEFAMRTRVLRRAWRLVISVVPVATIFMVWDVYAVAQHHWWFDSAQVTGAIAVAAVPVEELAFFLVIPVCAVLTFEAVRSRWGWVAGDERVEES